MLEKVRCRDFFRVVFDSTASYRRLREGYIFKELSSEVQKYLLRLDVDDAEIERRRIAKGHDLSIEFRQFWEEPDSEEATALGYEILRYPNNVPEERSRIFDDLRSRF